MRLVMAASAVFLLASNAYAGFYTGNQLYSACTRTPDRSDPFVTGYITGWLDKREEDMVSTEEFIKDDQGDVSTEVGVDISYLAAAVDRGICAPPNATASQLSDVFCKYLRDNPAERAHPSGIPTSVSC